MAIWRGAGGPGDATTDAANEASVASTKAAEAAASATAAAGSATSAANSATNAANSATASSTSASSASSSATSAASSASSASTSATNASTSASSASTSASSASSSASAAASSASAASSSASAAATAQTNAETAETNAETAQTAAEAARDAALAALDNFDDRYLGEKASDPTLDNDGDALVAGALYFNTTSNIMKVYTGSAWVAAYVSGSIDLDSVTDVTITSVADNEVLAYDSTSSKWINQTVAEAGLVATSDIGSTVQAYSSVLQNTTASYTTAEETKLAGIETAADVTDATNVAAAGAVMDTDFSTNGLMKRTGAGTYTIVTDNSSEWDTAYSWGNHASAGYLTSYTETDPVYTASTWYSTTNNSSNWDTAYGWGNHASAGYATYPSQTGNNGKYLTTDGSTVSWATVSVDADPAGTAVAMAIALG